MSAPEAVTLKARGQRLIARLMPQLLARGALYLLPHQQVWVLTIDLEPSGKYTARLTHGSWDELVEFSTAEVIAKVRAFASQVPNALLVLVEQGSEQYQEVVSWSATRTHPQPTN